MKPQENKKVEASAQAHLPIAEIKEGTVILKDGSFKAVVIVSAMNFALKSEPEKEAIIVSYQNFLNSLSFPIQIVATSRKLDLSNYIATVSKMAESQTNPLLQIQTQEYIAFINELLESSNIMEKRFYLVIPYYPGGLENISPGIMKKKKLDTPMGTFEENKRNLLSRVEEIINGLSAIGLRCVALGTEDLLELYYGLYNPDIAQNIKLDVAKQDFGQTIVSSQENGGAV